MSRQRKRCDNVRRRFAFGAQKIIDACDQNVECSANFDDFGWTVGGTVSTSPRHLRVGQAFASAALHRPRFGRRPGRKQQQYDAGC